MANMKDDPRFDITEDGSAKNPAGFREALREDAEKMKQIEEDPELAEALFGDDTNKMQEMLKQIYKAAKQAADRDQKEKENLTSVDMLRASSRVPRDPVALYEGMLQAGLQYGPAFRLLTDVYVPESVIEP